MTLINNAVLTLLACRVFLYTSIPSSSAFLLPLFKEQPLAVSPDSTRWASENNLDNKYAITSTLFQQVALHLHMHTDSNGSRASCPPFLMRRNENAPMMIEFNCDDLEAALSCDYLSACTGTRKSNEGKIGGWEMEDLGGKEDEHGYNQDVHSFQAQRLDWKEVLNAPNTIIFNSAGSYISSTLAATSLAALHGLDGAAVGVCMNLYVTPANVKTSAPPHTDKQDVVVVQTQGRKRWRVYSPPDSSLNSELDPFKRGKGTDSLTLDMLKRENSVLLLDVTLHPGDTLFVPARFPHTTDTLACYGDEEDAARSFDKEDWSMHLTVGLDSHVWNMNYISMRTLALRSHGIHDVLLQQTAQNYDRNMDMCVGRVNQLSNGLREGLYSSVTLSSRSKNDHSSPKSAHSMKKLASNLLSFHDRTNLECGVTLDVSQSLTFDQCLKTIIHFQNVGQKIANTHQDMYVAAVKEEQMRVDEQGGWALNVGNSMPNERARRLSIFRVPVYFQKMDMLREELRAWGDTSSGIHEKGTEIPMILIGDQVESIFPINLCREVNGEYPFNSAKVIKISNDGMLFDLQYFNGMVKKEVERSSIRGPHGIGIFI